jgi:hypothetical protein
MKTHRMLLIASVVLVALLISTGVALAQGLINNLVVNNEDLSGANYQTALLQEGENVYVDRGYTFTSVPDSLLNEEFIRTANDDKSSNGDAPFITFEVNQNVTVCGGHDNRITNKPNWLTSFEDTGEDLQTDDPRSQGFSVFCRDFPSGSVALGGNHPAGVTMGDQSMYTVVVLPQEVAPPPPQGEFPLDLVVFNNAQANFFLNNPQWVHPGDKFMIVSANAFSGDNEDYNPSFVNNTAQRLLNRFPQTEVLATTSGRRNTRTAINTVNRNLIDIVMTVWEPRNPDFPTDAFNQNDSATVNRVTREFAQEMTNLAHNRGLEYWMMPTGRSTIDRPKAGVLSYRDIIRITDGMNVMTQGSCVQNTFGRAVSGLINDYRATGTLDRGLKDFFVQISLSGSGPNEVTPARAFQCAQVGWSRQPVDAVTMWWAASVPEDARDFLRRREALLD